MRGKLIQITLQYKIDANAKYTAWQTGANEMTDRPTNLGDLEKAAYESRWRDGLLDLIGGIGVLMVGAAWSIEAFWAVGFALPILLVAWIVTRKRVVEPRIGRVTFRKARREKEEGGNRAAAWFGAGLLLFFVALHVLEVRRGGGIDAWLQEWIAALPTALLALMALNAAAMTGLHRFVAYAAVLLSTGTVATWLGMEPGPQILIAGGIISAVGLRLFARFLSGHPIPAERGDNP